MNLICFRTYITHFIAKKSTDWMMATTPVELPSECIFLALGFGFITEAVAAQLKDSQASDLTNPYVRDRARLLALQQHLRSRLTVIDSPHLQTPHKQTKPVVVSINLDRPVNDCEPGQHIRGNFTRPEIDILLAKRLAPPSSDTTPTIVSAVFCEYLRMPTAYMRQVFVPFISTTFPRWKRHGFVDTKTMLVVPNLHSMIRDNDEVVAALRDLYDVRFLTAAENDMYVASDSVDPSIVGVSHLTECATHADHLKQLDHEYPFLSLHLKRSE